MASDPSAAASSAASADTMLSVTTAVKSQGESKTGSNLPYRTIVPSQPRAEPSAFTQAVTDEVEIGNKKFEVIQYSAGLLGHRLPRSNLEESPKYIEIACDKMRDSICHTLGAAIYRLLNAKGVLPSQENTARTMSASTAIANGTMMVLYKKLRAIHLTEFDEFAKFARKPKVSDSIELPLPYAYAIQTIGKVKVANLETDLEIVPTYPAAETYFGMDPNYRWSPVEHALQVEYVKSLGIPFCTVNLDVKVGSAWWLLHQDDADGTVRISCTLPECNFTEQSAVISSMFMKSETTVKANDIANLSGLEKSNYGIMLQNPPIGVNICAFHAIAGMAESIWQF